MLSWNMFCVRKHHDPPHLLPLLPRPATYSISHLPRLRIGRVRVLDEKTAVQAAVPEVY